MPSRSKVDLAPVLKEAGAKLNFDILTYLESMKGELLEAIRGTARPPRQSEPPKDPCILCHLDNHLADDGCRTYPRLAEATGPGQRAGEMHSVPGAGMQRTMHTAALQRMPTGTSPEILVSETGALLTNQEAPAKNRPGRTIEESPTGTKIVSREIPLIN
ncbi:hypothetical protein WR25_02236 [Diploscapter pachys]|uniref:Uncharacterized protein n=1 Tax=Diploscapter pachys TaxID=2018661 RepID=A0A2A2M4F8_9BILA|nr:hypothetical protein WR25_02236 [Diploscapter pachys]